MDTVEEDVAVIESGMFGWMQVRKKVDGHQLHASISIYGKITTQAVQNTNAH